MKRIASGLILFFALALTPLLGGCAVTDYIGGLFGGSKNALPKKQIVLKAAGENIQLTVEVADDAQERQSGLMEREKLEEGTGMLFVFEDEAPRKFWMKNTLIPLDIVYFNNKKEAVSIVSGMTPCKVADCPSYPSEESAMYALELPAGFVSARGIEEGNTFVEAE